MYPYSDSHRTREELPLTVYLYLLTFIFYITTTHISHSLSHTQRDLLNTGRLKVEYRDSLNMYRQSPSRNQRSKGFKVKHALQIFLLVAVCFWLIYQVKHSSDKKKVFDDNDARISHNIQTQSEILKLGRKGLHPQVKETSKHEEEAEEEIEEVDIKAEEREDEVKGGGDDDDEVDEHDREKSDSELDRDVEIVNEEKELEEVDEMKDREKEVIDKDRKTDIENSVDNLDHGRGTHNTHEAREEQYNADDASSAVTHEGQTISSENESGSTQNQTNIAENENEGNNTVESNIGQNVTDLKVHEEEMAESGISSNFIPEKGSEVSNSTTQGNTFLNSTITTESSDQLKLSNHTAEVNTESRDLLNGTEISILDLNHAQNDTEEGKISAAGSNIQTVSVEHANSSSIVVVNSQFDSNSTAFMSTGNVESNPGVFSNYSNHPIASEHTAQSNASAETKDGSEINAMKENIDVHQNEKSDLSAGAGGNYGGSNSSNTENASKLQNETDDSITMEDKLAELDPDTLPDVRIEAGNSEEAAEE